MTHAASFSRASHFRCSSASTAAAASPPHSGYSGGGAQLVARGGRSPPSGGREEAAVEYRLTPRSPRASLGSPTGLGASPPAPSVEYRLAPRPVQPDHFMPLMPCESPTAHGSGVSLQRAAAARGGATPGKSPKRGGKKDVFTSLLGPGSRL